MNDQERSRRIRQVLAEELESGKTGWYYLSFSDGHFLGAAFVHALGPGDAVRQTHRLKINPGGTAAILPVPPEKMNIVGEQWRHRLLSFADMEKAGLEPTRMPV